MARKSTCPKCNMVIEPNENFKVYQNRKYHIKCYKELVKEVYNSNTQQQDSKTELYNYICLLFEIDQVTPLIKTQIEKYYTEYEFTYDGMLYSLKYFFEILENDVHKTQGIGIIPYIYKEAREFYIQKNHLLETDFDLKNSVTHKTIKIKSIDYTSKNLIDIENL